MNEGPPVWLIPADIIRKNEKFCFQNNITERSLSKLVEAFLLRGRKNHRTKKLEILEESFEILKRHIEYRYLKCASLVDAKNLSKKPEYLKVKYSIYYDKSHSWYSYSELREFYNDILQWDTCFDCKFIGDCVTMRLLDGRYSQNEKCYLIQLSSFVDLLKLRDYCIDRAKWLPPSSGTARK